MKKEIFTREDLSNWGLHIFETSPGNYRIFHRQAISRLNKKGDKVVELHPTIGKTRHPKGIIGTQYYYILSWNHNGPHSYTLQQVIYAWFWGSCDPSLDVAHKVKDNFVDSLDNDWRNLTQKSRADNLAERRGYINQYGYKKK